MRRPRLLLAGAALAPLLLVAGCSGQDVPVRGENGSGVDTKAPGSTGDQSGDSATPQ